MTITLARGAIVRLFRGAPARATASVLEHIAGAPHATFAVLTYHRVDHPKSRPFLYPALLSATPTHFERQMRDLTKYAKPIAVGDVLAAYRGHRELPERAVLVTFDDAYRDFQQNAWPVLKRLGVPVTLFVPTGYPDVPHQVFWWDRLWQALMESRGSAKLETPIGSLTIRNESERRRAGRALIEFHKTLPHLEAMQSVDTLCERIGGTPATSEVLGWEELRALSADGVDLATHSRTHPILTRLALSDLEAELAGARSDLARHVSGSHPTVFAYPSGRYNEVSTLVLAKLGFELAFTTDRGANRARRTHSLRLRRINIGVRSHSELIRAQIAVSTLSVRLTGG